MKICEGKVAIKLLLYLSGIEWGDKALWQALSCEALWFNEQESVVFL